MRNISNVMRILRAIWRAIKLGDATLVTAEIGVSMSCRDANGQLKWTDVANTRRVTGPLYTPGLRLAAWFLWISIGALTLTMMPEFAIGVPVVARVATVGLNKLLDYTLKSGVTSPTWYVGLIKQSASDGAITASAATFTSSGASFDSGDIGRHIIVQGAGTSGADLYTTISAVGSTTSITLANNAGTTVSGARYAYECKAASTMGSHAEFTESTSYSNSTRVAWTPGSVSAGSVDNSGSVAAFTINATDYIFGAFLVDNSTKSGTTGNLFGCGVNSSGIARQVANGDTLNVTVTCTATAA